MGKPRQVHWIALAVLAITLGLVSLVSRNAEALRSDGAPARDADAGLLTQPLEVPEPATPLAADTITAESHAWSVVEVRRGDNLAQIFARQGLSPKDLHDILAAGKPATALRRVYPGDELRLRRDAAGELQSLVYPMREWKLLRVDRTPDGWNADVEERELELRTRYAVATITSSLFLAGQKAGLSDKLIMKLANIFGWDVDFALDIRSGDQFIVLYEEKLLEGEKVGDGDILAAEFVNRGRTYRAIRFVDPERHADYFTPEGMSVRRAFLRTPVEFSRISSGFSLARKHPVLNRIRAHKGVDYAAPTGTPVRAAGDGKVVFVGRKGGYGNAIVLQHGSQYSTLYGHLSRFARGTRTGARVRQGQTIGYVGSTGLATGPHLHYEFRINGVHRNPLTVKLPQAEPIANRYREAFLREAEGWSARLDTLRNTMVATRATSTE